MPTALALASRPNLSELAEDWGDAAADAIGKLDFARLSSAGDALRSLLADLDAQFVERRDVIRSIAIALLAREHVCLLGDPGVGKSAITNQFCKAIGGTFFSVLLTKFSVPEEVFGPVSLVGLEHDQYRRVTTGYLPEATVGFVDEIFKANSAILNSLLTIANERLFDNGGARTKVPLEMLIGASNELPQDDSLAALWDRFMLRIWVDPVRSRDAMKRLLGTRGEPTVSAGLDRDDLAALRAAVDAVIVPDEVLDLLLDLRDALAQDHGISASDRRWRKMVRLIQANAVLNGRYIAERTDIMVLADALWRTPEERAKTIGTLARIASPDLAAALALHDAAVEAFGKVDLNKSPIGDTKDGAGKVTDVGLATTNENLKRMLEMGSALDQSGGVDEIIAKIRDMQMQLARASRKRMGI